MSIHGNASGNPYCAVRFGSPSDTRPRIHSVGKQPDRPTAAAQKNQPPLIHPPPHFSRLRELATCSFSWEHCSIIFNKYQNLFLCLVIVSAGNPTPEASCFLKKINDLRSLLIFAWQAAISASESLISPA